MNLSALGVDTRMQNTGRCQSSVWTSGALGFETGVQLNAQSLFTCSAHGVQLVCTRVSSLSLASLYLTNSSGVCYESLLDFNALCVKDFLKVSKNNEQELEQSKGKSRSQSQNGK